MQAKGSENGSAQKSKYYSGSSGVNVPACRDQALLELNIAFKSSARNRFKPRITEDFSLKPRSNLKNSRIEGQLIRYGGTQNLKSSQITSYTSGYPYGHPLGVNFTSEGSTPKGIFFGWCSQGGWDVPSYTGTLVWDVPLEQWDPEYGTSQPAAGGENFVGYPTCVTSRCPKNWLFQGSWPALGQGAYGPKPLGSWPALGQGAGGPKPLRAGLFLGGWPALVGFSGAAGQHLARVLGVQNPCKQG
ncbi:hypothetical protein C8R43DRAFT_961010 [Mycena crocata]|nr:hypothetical protein C8R43DRAFT_961010 [Mycena crocata]